jgi:hypothetical protein
MRRASLIALAAMASIMARPQTTVAADCFELWLAADTDRNGALEAKEDERGYIKAVERAIGATPKPGVISRDLFMASCRDGVFSDPTAGPGPEAEPPNIAADAGPLGEPRPNALPPDRGKGDITPGLRPLSEGEARSRLRENGFAEVSDLALGSAGVWRGTAIVNGKRVGVAVDPQGDIIGGR